MSTFPFSLFTTIGTPYFPFSLPFLRLLFLAMNETMVKEVDGYDDYDRDPNAATNYDCACVRFFVFWIANKTRKAIKILPFVFKSIDLILTPFRKKEAWKKPLLLLSLIAPSPKINNSLISFDLSKKSYTVDRSIRKNKEESFRTTATTAKTFDSFRAACLLPVCVKLTFNQQTFGRWESKKKHLYCTYK